jgi:tetratricopeptide (TPR) repeat protein
MDEARALDEAALRVHRETGNRLFEGHVLASLAEANMVAGRYDVAEHLHGEALRIAREVGNRRDEGLELANLANVHRICGRAEQAYERFQEAIQVLDASGDRRFAGAVRGTFAVVASELARPRHEVDEHLSLAESNLRSIGDRFHLGRFLCAKGDVLSGRGDRDAALVALHEAESIMRELELLPGSELARGVDELRRLLGSSEPNARSP